MSDTKWNETERQEFQQIEAAGARETTTMKIPREMFSRYISLRENLNVGVVYRSLRRWRENEKLRSR